MSQQTWSNFFPIFPDAPSQIVISLNLSNKYFQSTKFIDHSFIFWQNAELDFCQIVDHGRNIHNIEDQKKIAKWHFVWQTKTQPPWKVFVVLLKKAKVIFQLVYWYFKKVETQPCIVVFHIKTTFVLIIYSKKDLLGKKPLPFTLKYFFVWFLLERF